MENAIKIAEVAGPVYIVIGLSLLIYTKSWQKIITGWLKNHYTLIPLAMIQMVLGIIVIRMYNVWTWDIWLLVTLLGWIMLAKSVVYFLAPGFIIKWSLSMKKSIPLLAIGAVIVTLWGLALTYYAYQAFFQSLI
jgi:hypothetical protein